MYYKKLWYGVFEKLSKDPINLRKMQNILRKNKNAFDPDVINSELILNDFVIRRTGEIEKTREKSGSLGLVMSWELDKDKVNDCWVGIGT